MLLIPIHHGIDETVPGARTPNGNVGNHLQRMRSFHLDKNTIARAVNFHQPTMGRKHHNANTVSRDSQLRSGGLTVTKAPNKPKPPAPAPPPPPVQNAVVKDPAVHRQPIPVNSTALGTVPTPNAPVRMPRMPDEEYLQKHDDMENIPHAPQPALTPLMQDIEASYAGPSQMVPSVQKRPALVTPSQFPSLRNMQPNSQFWNTPTTPAIPTPAAIDAGAVNPPSKIPAQTQPLTPPAEENLADFARGAYHPEMVLDGYEKDTELSGPDRTLYYNKKTKKAILAFRGTDTDNHMKRDVLTDLGLGLGLESHLNRFKHSMDVTERAIAKYGKDNLQVTGHSLGGSQALYVGQHLGVKGAAYNPYTHFWRNPTTTWSQWFHHPKLAMQGIFGANNPVETYVVAGDPVSSQAMQDPRTHVIHARGTEAKIVGAVAAGAGISAATESGGPLLTALGTVPKNLLHFHSIENFTTKHEFGTEQGEL